MLFKKILYESHLSPQIIPEYWDYMVFFKTIL